MEESLSALVKFYISCCRTEGKSPATVRWYRQKLDYFVRFLMERGLARKVSEIGKREIRAFIQHLQTEVRADENNPRKPTREKGLSPHTVQGYARALRAFFSWAVREGFLDESPMKGIKMPKIPKLMMPCFMKDEARRLLDPASYNGQFAVRNRTIVMLLLDTGIRLSELTRLRMRDLHLEEGWFKVNGKGSRERNVPMGHSCRTAMWRYVTKDRPEPAAPGIDNVFLNRSGRPLSGDWIYKIISDVCRKAGIQGKRLGPHTCRHTFAKSFLMNGGDLLTLQRILGHSSLEVVRMYVDLNVKDLIEQQRQFSPVDRLNER